MHLHLMQPTQHFFFDNQYHLDVHHNMEEKICRYSRYITTVRENSCFDWIAWPKAVVLCSAADFQMFLRKIDAIDEINLKKKRIK